MLSVSRMIAAALGHVVLRAPAVIARGFGNAGVMLAARPQMGLAVQQRFAALAARRHAGAHAVTAGALAAAAQVALRMIGRAPDLALQLVVALTVIAVAAGGIVD